MVLGTLESDDDEPAFSQGGLQQFRDRLIAGEMDRRLLERTVEVAMETKDFAGKKTPKSLRVGVDSRPLEGAGRVEDTINLLGHAGRKIAECIALTLGVGVEEVCQQANVPLLMASSFKAGLDIDWSAPDAKASALNRLCRQLDRLMAFASGQPARARCAPTAPKPPPAEAGPSPWASSIGSPISPTARVPRLATARRRSPRDLTCSAPGAPPSLRRTSVFGIRA